MCVQPFLQTDYIVMLQVLKISLSLCKRVSYTQHALSNTSKKTKGNHFVILDIGGGGGIVLFVEIFLSFVFFVWCLFEIICVFCFVFCFLFSYCFLSVFFVFIIVFCCFSVLFFFLFLLFFLISLNCI